MRLNQPGEAKVRLREDIPLRTAALVGRTQRGLTWAVKPMRSALSVLLEALSISPTLMRRLTAVKTTTRRITLSAATAALTPTQPQQPQVCRSLSRYGTRRTEGPLRNGTASDDPPRGGSMTRGDLRAHGDVYRR
jgi:hypothetical protein